jgi:cell division protein FtsI (penicillin-binding protein 3)
MKFTESPVLAARFPRWRSRCVLGLLASSFLLLAGRAVYLQLLANDFLRAKGESRYSRVIEISANRGRVLDRNGEALAVSTPVKSIWAIPDDVVMDARQLDRVARLLGMPKADISRRLAEGERDFVFIKRQVSPEVAQLVADLRIPGLYQSREYRRYYPGGEVLAPVLGFTGAEDVGQEGIELAYQRHLAGKPGSKRVIKDRLGQVV